MFGFEKRAMIRFINDVKGYNSYIYNENDVQYMHLLPDVAIQVLTIQDFAIEDLATQVVSRTGT